MNNDDRLRYPIGKFTPKDAYTPDEVFALIQVIEQLPVKLEQAINEMPAHQIDMPYREGGWTVRQVVHHLADSHMNAYIRFKWTLTEDTPTIKAYEEKLWAITPETKADPALSIALLKALHQKWAILLKALTPEDLTKEFIHPETKRRVSLARMVALYAWHGNHHLGHINIVRAQ